MIGIWVAGKWGKHGWLEEESGAPAVFKALIDAKDWIRSHAVHKQYYEPKTITKKDVANGSQRLILPQ